MEIFQGLIMAGQLLLGLSILVGLHELGHLLTAKFFGMKVEKYFIGFPPKIWSTTYKETEYGIGAIPLGGFVKIAGMIDESLDTKLMNTEPQPWEFRSKPAWQRLIVMLGGIIVNVITGVLIFIALTYKNGETYFSKNEVNKNGVVAYELGQSIGFKTGDKILTINGKDYEKFNDVYNPELLMSTDAGYTIQRGDTTIEIKIPSNFLDQFATKDKGSVFVEPRMPFSVGVLTNGPAKEAGIETGDQILAIDTVPVKYFDEIRKELTQKAGKTVTVSLLRNGQQIDKTLTVSAEGTIGFRPNILLQSSSVSYSFLESIQKGSAQAFSVVWINIKAFGKMFSGEMDPRKSLSGPIGIAQIFGGTWEWDNFWRITGLLSMVLAFMNLLPIPALDGGHVVFLTYEIVSGRKPSDKFLEYAQRVGMVLLLGLMVFAFGNDILKFFN